MFLALHVHLYHIETTNIACIGGDSQTEPTSRHKIFGLQRAITALQPPAYPLFMRNEKLEYITL